MLYLVRWENLEASLVRADSEHELLQILDEVADPNGCVWEPYHGPLWIDLELNAEVVVEGAGDDPLKATDVEVRAVPTSTFDALTPRWCADSPESIDAQRRAIRFAFPHVARALEPATVDDVEVDPTDVAEAVKREYLDDEQRFRDRAVIWKHAAGQLWLQPIQRHVFALKTSGDFETISRNHFDDICLGKAPAPPEFVVERHFHFAVVEVEIDDSIPVEAELHHAVRLGVGAEGHIIDVHRANLSDKEIAANLVGRRNAVVAWTLPHDARDSLRSAVAARLDEVELLFEDE